ncbi:MAG: hypothetical protein JSS00_14500 [Proteobacteria bacterium]|nr:hypothetical protein [Pseudomonadota bacterium]
MVWWWWIIPGLVAVVGLAIALSGVGWMFRGRPFKGGRGVFGGGLFLAVAALVSLLGLNIQTYSRLNAERQVATVDLRKLGPEHFQATVTEAANADHPQPIVHIFDVQGDEWRLEARVLKWKPWANVLGLDAQYRLDRFSGRYTETADEQTRPRSVYSLLPERRTGLDFLPVARSVTQYLPLVDIPQYGQGVYMPMADGAQYQVTILSSGALLPRPSNEAAAEAVAGWHN